jgi:hypothetical protein
MLISKQKHVSAGSDCVVELSLGQQYCGQAAQSFHSCVAITGCLGDGHGTAQTLGRSHKVAAPAKHRAQQPRSKTAHRQVFLGQFFESHADEFCCA